MYRAGAFVFACCLLGACGSRASDVLTAERQKLGGDRAAILITSKIDGLVVKDVTVNRGNCTSIGIENAKLKIGEKARAVFGNCSEPLEAKIATSEGDLNFSWRD